jgi:putative transposase
VVGSVDLPSRAGLLFALRGAPVNHGPMSTILTPFRAPNANTVAERWIHIVREECLDRLLIWTEQHLKHILVAYIQYYNECLPHQGLHQHSPLARDTLVTNAPIRYRNILGGILRDHYREAA